MSLLLLMVTMVDGRTTSKPASNESANSLEQTKLARREVGGRKRLTGVRCELQSKAVTTARTPCGACAKEPLSLKSFKREHHKIL